MLCTNEYRKRWKNMMGKEMQPMMHMLLWDFHMPFKFGHMKLFFCLE